MTQAGWSSDGSIFSYSIGPENQFRSRNFGQVDLAERQSVAKRWGLSETDVAVSVFPQSEISP